MTGIPITEIRGATEAEYAAYHDEAETAANEAAFSRDMLAFNAELTHGLIGTVRVLANASKRYDPIHIDRPGAPPKTPVPVAAPAEPLSHAAFAARIRAGEL